MALQSFVLFIDHCGPCSIVIIYTHSFQLNTISGQQCCIYLLPLAHHHKLMTICTVKTKHLQHFHYLAIILKKYSTIEEVFPNIWGEYKTWSRVSMLSLPPEKICSFFSSEKITNLYIHISLDHMFLMI